MPQDPISDQQSDPLGSNLGTLEARIEALEKTGQWWPGMIGWTAATSPPAGWLVADGSTFDVDRYAALSAALNGASVLPNLIDSFPIGAGGVYTLLSTGGADSVTLTSAQSGIPAHTHPGGTTGTPSAVNTGAGTAHSHGPGIGGTLYVLSGAGGVALSLIGGAQSFPTAGATGTESAHTHPPGAHTHATPTVAASTAANAASPVSVLNPYVALTPLIHI